MAVNDSTDLLNATENCAICTVAGLFGRTYAQFIRAAGRTDSQFRNGGTSTVASFFADYKARRGGPALTEDNKTELQVAGVALFLQERGMQNVVTHGSLDQPLTGNELITRLHAFPVGTKFAILIGRSFGLNHFAGGAHWIACHREQDVPALRFVDYQLDTNFTATDLRNYHVPKGTRLGSPHESNVPTRPWGQSPNTAEDRFVAISFTPPA